MIKLTFALVRLPGLSREDFQDYWFNRHGPLVASVSEVLGIRRYVQMHSLPDAVSEPLRASRGAPEPYDGVAQLWYDSLEDMLTEHDVAKTPYAAPAVKDHNLFIDDDRSVACFTDEHPIVEPGGAVPYVLIGCLRRGSGIEPAEFQRAWLSQANIVRQAHAQGLIEGLVQNHAHIGNTGNIEGIGSAEEPWDGIETTYFNSIAGFKTFAASEIAQKWFEAEKTFIDHERSVYVLTRRHVIKKLVR